MWSVSSRMHFRSRQAQVLRRQSYMLKRHFPNACRPSVTEHDHTFTCTDFRCGQTFLQYPEIAWKWLGCSSIAESTYVTICHTFTIHRTVVQWLYPFNWTHKIMSPQNLSMKIYCLSITSFQFEWANSYTRLTTRTACRSQFKAATTAFSLHQKVTFDTCFPYSFQNNLRGPHPHHLYSHHPPLLLQLSSTLPLSQRPVPNWK